MNCNCLPIKCIPIQSIKTIYLRVVVVYFSYIAPNIIFIVDYEKVNLGIKKCFINRNVEPGLSEKLFYQSDVVKIEINSVQKSMLNSC